MNRVIAFIRRFFNTTCPGCGDGRVVWYCSSNEKYFYIPCLTCGKSREWYRPSVVVEYKKQDTQHSKSTDVRFVRHLCGKPRL